nr:hypothetical protein [Cressdnaviricota sp.]
MNLRKLTIAFICHGVYAKEALFSAATLSPTASKAPSSHDVLSKKGGLAKCHVRPVRKKSPSKDS